MAGSCKDFEFNPIKCLDDFFLRLEAPMQCQADPTDANFEEMLKLKQNCQILKAAAAAANN